MYRRILVLGGAGSGKSAFAEGLATELGDPVLYVATATALDEEMADRIRHHQARRPATWRTLEEPRRVSEQAAAGLGDARTVLVEDLTLLLANGMAPAEVSGDMPPGTPARTRLDWGMAGHEAEESTLDISGDVGPLGGAENFARGQIEGLLALPANVVLVSNEVGLGIVPAFTLGRLFRDAQGRLNQHAAARADEVFLVVAGLPLRLKPSPFAGGTTS